MVAQVSSHFQGPDDSWRSAPMPPQEQTAIQDLDSTGGHPSSTDERPSATAIPYQVEDFYEEMFCEADQPRPPCRSLYERMQKLR